eukprot:m.14388 g.14388  ORF g.14388 m.14388 type:complete len:442 (-) comp6256_c0_seq1:108-1433(-)
MARFNGAVLVAAVVAALALVASSQEVKYICSESDGIGLDGEMQLKGDSAIPIMQPTTDTCLTRIRAPSRNTLIATLTFAADTTSLWYEKAGMRMNFRVNQPVRASSLDLAWLPKNQTGFVLYVRSVPIIDFLKPKNYFRMCRGNEEDLGAYGVIATTLAYRWHSQYGGGRQCQFDLKSPAPGYKYVGRAMEVDVETCCDDLESIQHTGTFNLNDPDGSFTSPTRLNFNADFKATYENYMGAGFAFMRVPIPSEYSTFVPATEFNVCPVSATAVTSSDDMFGALTYNLVSKAPTASGCEFTVTARANSTVRLYIETLSFDTTDTAVFVNGEPVKTSLQVISGDPEQDMVIRYSSSHGNVSDGAFASFRLVWQQVTAETQPWEIIDWATIGAAALPADEAEFFDALGPPIKENLSTTGKLVLGLVFGFFLLIIVLAVVLCLKD